MANRFRDLVLKKLLLTLSLSVLASLARAGDCDDLQDATLQELFGAMTEAPRHTACRTWPGDESKTIVLLADRAPPTEAWPATDDGEGLYNLHIAVRDGSSVLHATEKNALTSDAFALQGLAVDGVTYPLAQGVKAFGVRARRSNRHADIETLSLYAVRDGKLVRILAPVNTLASFSEASNEVDCFRSSVTRSTLALATPATSTPSKRGHQWTDLVISQRSTVREPKPGDPACTTTESHRIHRYRLRFDGQTYPVPTALSPAY
jgi:hypothetical protein